MGETETGGGDCLAYSVAELVVSCTVINLGLRWVDELMGLPVLGCCLLYKAQTFATLAVLGRGRQKAAI